MPEADIIRRYFRSKNLFLNTYRHMVDEWLLFYNGDDKFELIANNDDVIDEMAYNKFMEDIHE